MSRNFICSLTNICATGILIVNIKKFTKSMEPEDYTTEDYVNYLKNTTFFLNSALAWLEKSSPLTAYSIKKRQASDQLFFQSIFSRKNATMENTQRNYHSHLYYNRLSHLYLIYQCDNFDSFLREKLSKEDYSEYEQDENPVLKDKFLVIAGLLNKSMVLPPDIPMSRSLLMM